VEQLRAAKTRIGLKEQRLRDVDRLIAAADHRVYQRGEMIDGKYTVVRVLTGGFGLIYFCCSRASFGPLVIKTILPELLPTSSVRNSFRREADAWIRVGEHNHLARALYVGDLDDCLAIHFELVIGDPRFGTDLSGYLGRHTPDLPSALLLARGICAGLDQPLQQTSTVLAAFSTN
jgi:hypothetical protein